MKYRVTVKFTLTRVGYEHCFIEADSAEDARFKVRHGQVEPSQFSLPRYSDAIRDDEHVIDVEEEAA